jgi:hypothetical protein
MPQFHYSKNATLDLSQMQGTNDTAPQQSAVAINDSDNGYESWKGISESL